MKRLAFFTVLALFVLVTAPPLSWIVPGARADGGGFSTADLDGSYGFSFDGSVFGVGESLGVDGYVPLSAVGQFDADEGTVTELKRTLNVGGVLIVKETFTGQATVEEDGTGTARFCSTGRTFVPDPPPVPFPTVTYEEFSFVITGEDNNEVEFIGTTLIGGSNENGAIAGCNLAVEGGFFGVEPVLIPVSVRGIARAQDEGGDDDD